MDDSILLQKARALCLIKHHTSHLRCEDVEVVAHDKPNWAGGLNCFGKLIKYADALTWWLSDMCVFVHVREHINVCDCVLCLG